jgi:hypothetical protein
MGKKKCMIARGSYRDNRGSDVRDGYTISWPWDATDEPHCDEHKLEIDGDSGLEQTGWDLQPGSCTCVFSFEEVGEGGTIVPPTPGPIVDPGPHHPLYPLPFGRKSLNYLIVTFHVRAMTPQRRRKLRALLADPKSLDSTLDLLAKARRHQSRKRKS